MTIDGVEIAVRNTQPRDFAGIIQMCKEIYAGGPPWNEAQLQSHYEVFPEGQFVAAEASSRRVVGMGASLIILSRIFILNATVLTF